PCSTEYRAVSSMEAFLCKASPPFAYTYKTFTLKENQLFLNTRPFRKACTETQEMWIMFAGIPF
ncbi:MAG: hypothetical protein ACK5L3_12885, partial [Oscillospiraceae bacterium]